MKGKIGIFLIGLFFVVVTASVVLAQMGVPNQFYGTATYNGAASEGIKIDAYIEGVIVETIFAQSGGFYNLKVKDPEGNREGDTILFYVNGVNTGQTAVFENGASTKLDLSASGPSNGGDGGGPGGGGGSVVTTSTSEDSGEGEFETLSSDANETSEEINVGGGITGAAVGAGSSKGILTLLAILVIFLVGILGYFGWKKRSRK